MQAIGARWRLFGLVAGAIITLSACAHHHDSETPSDEGINAYPANYKTDILGAIHVYLEDPTGIRDGAISEPTQKAVGNATRYVACLRFNARKSGREYAGAKEMMAVFLAGHFDHFVENAGEQCAGVSYTPFPELGKLKR